MDSMPLFLFSTTALNQKEQKNKAKNSKQISSNKRNKLSKNKWSKQYRLSSWEINKKYKLVKLRTWLGNESILE